MKFSEFLDVRDGTHDSPKRVNIGKKLITTKNLEDNRIDFTNAKNISLNDFKRINERSRVDQFDILLSMIGTVGNVYQERSAFPDYAIKNLALLKFHGDELLSNWMNYYLQSKKGQSKIHQRLSGSTQQYISLTDLRNIEITLPNRDQMELCIKPLRYLDDLILKNNQINDNLTKLINLLFLEVYKSALLYKPLKEVANVSNGYAFKSKDLLDVPIDNSSPVFKMGNIKNNGGFDHTKIKSWVTPDYYPKDKFLAQYGDILMSMTDMKDNVRILGHTALMDVDKKYYINQRVCLIRPTKLPFEYLYPLTNSDDYINELRKHANHGVQVNLTIKSIKDSKIRIPNNNQLQKYIKLVRPLFEQLINNNQENLIMSQIKCNLLNKFF